MFQDEARFGRINDPRRCWAPKSKRPIAPCQVVREFTYAYAAASPSDGVMDSLILPFVNTEMMSLFLEEVGRRHKDEFVLMFLDGAGWHRSKSLKIPVNMKIERLPPYSPELNPIEHIWEEIREKWFANEAFKSMKFVEDQLETALFQLENDKEKVRHITGFDWILTSI